MKKMFGLFVRHAVGDNFISASSSCFLICASSDFDILTKYCETLQKSADLMANLLPSRGNSTYHVDEIHLIDL